jgi:SPP1 family predicted phage head-tail adaptor
MTAAYLRAGQLNRQVSIQQRTVTPDTFGGRPETWTEIKKVYAYIEALGGMERAQAQAISVDISHKFTVRYDDGLFADPKIAAGYRIVYNSRIFDIQAPLNVDEANRIVEILASEGMSLG